MTGPADTVEAAEVQVNVPLVPCSALSIYSAPPPSGRSGWRRVAAVSPARVLGGLVFTSATGPGK